MTIRHSSRARRTRLSVFAGVAMLVSVQGFAQKNYWTLTEADLRILPPFCRTGFQGYLSGTDGSNMNHLCPGLNALNDAQRSLGNSTQRGYALSEAIDHLSYTLRHPNPTHPLRPMVLVKRGNAYEMQGNMGKAIADYSQSVRVNPRYLYGYAALSDAYLKLGDKKSALSAIEDGLKVSPASKPLLARKQKISGT